MIAKTKLITPKTERKLADLCVDNSAGHL